MPVFLKWTSNNCYASHFDSDNLTLTLLSVSKPLEIVYSMKSWAISKVFLQFKYQLVSCWQGFFNLTIVPQAAVSENYSSPGVCGNQHTWSCRNSKPYFYACSFPADVHRRYSWLQRWLLLPRGLVCHIPHKIQTLWYPAQLPPL